MEAKECHVLQSYGHGQDFLGLTWFAFAIELVGGVSSCGVQEGTDEDE